MIRLILFDLQAKIDSTLCSMGYSRISAQWVDSRIIGLQVDSRNNDLPVDFQDLCSKG